MATQNEVGTHIDLSERQVRTLIKDGVLPAATGTGGLNLDACRLAYIRYLRGLSRGAVRPEADADAGDLDAERERTLLMREQRIKVEMQNAVSRRELAPIQIIESVLAAAGAQISAVLESIPLKVKKRNPRLGAAEIEAIKREIISCQNIAATLTDAIDAHLDIDSSGDPDSDPAGTADPGATAATEMQ